MADKTMYTITDLNGNQTKVGATYMLYQEGFFYLYSKTDQSDLDAPTFVQNAERIESIRKEIIK